MTRRRVLLFIFSMGLVVARMDADVRPTIWPTKGWSSSTPEAQKMDSNVFKALDQEFAGGTYGYVDGFVIVRNGQLVFQRSYKQDYQKLFAGRGAPGIYNYYDPGWHPFYKGTDLHARRLGPRFDDLEDRHGSKGVRVRLQVVGDFPEGPDLV